MSNDMVIIALQQGIEGIQGLKGDKGDTGLQGLKGDKGDTGATGSQGLKGDTGLQGIQGIQGLKGDTGLTGTISSVGVLGASIRPSLLLDFANTKTLDPRITFTRQSSATYFGSDGLMKTTPAGIPRFTHDPVTDESLGYFSEEQRTNLLLQSNAPSDPAWNKLAITIQQNAVISPRGILDAHKLVEDTTTGSHSVIQNYLTGLLPSTVYTNSVYLKAAERSFCFLGFNGADTAVNYISVDLAGGTISNAAVSTPASFTSKIESVGNGWYRVQISVAMAVTITTGSQLDIRVSTDGVWANRSYTGNGTSGIYFCYAQVEQGASASSYIPTTSTQATRAADNAVMTGANFSNWVNASEGTFLVAGRSRKLGNFLVVDDGSYNNRLPQIDIGSTNNYEGFAVSGGSVIASLLPAGTNNETITQKISLAYKSADYGMVVNGGIPALNTNATLPSGINTMRIGTALGGASSINNTISKIAFYPKRLSNTELQAMTTL